MSPKFCHMGTKMSVLWPSKYTQNPFPVGALPSPHCGSSQRSSGPLVGWGGDTRPLTLSHSARTHLRRSPCVPPRIPARSMPLSHIPYVSREYGSSSYVKVIGSRSRSQSSHAQKNRKSLFPQCKTSIGNNLGSVKQSREICMQHGVFGYCRSNGATGIFVT